MKSYIDWYSWDDKPGNAINVLEDFNAAEEYKHNIEILMAHYTYEDYSGSAMVVYRDKRDGKWYEVNGSHCSCYGLEGQWEPEEVLVEELLQRPEYIYTWPKEARDRINAGIRAALKAELG